MPNGPFQIEADGFIWMTSSSGGARGDRLMFANPTFKYGLSDSSDIRINWVPLPAPRYLQP